MTGLAAHTSVRLCGGSLSGQLTVKVRLAPVNGVIVPNKLFESP
jgi:hypothetical protein